MYHYSARQALIDAKQQRLLTEAARARTLRELRRARRERRAALRTDVPAERPVTTPRPAVRPVAACPTEQPA